MPDKLVTMQHPSFEDVTVDVPADKVQEHVDAGWLKATSAAARRARDDAAE